MFYGNEFIACLAIGFALGIKPALEPNHIIALSTIASQSKKIWKSSLAGVFWGIGHLLILLVFGVILILLKNEIPEAWAMSKQTKRHDHTGRAT